MKKHSCKHCENPITCSNKENIQLAIDNHDKECKVLLEARKRA